MSKRNVETFAEEIIHVWCIAVEISPKVKNLVILFHRSLSMQPHVNTVDRVC